MDKGQDFVIATTLPDLVACMNRLTGTNLIDLNQLQAQIVVRDQQVDNPFTNDLQEMGIRNSLAYSGDSLARKTLGGLQADLSGRVLGSTGQPIPGLYASDEVAGFGGGGGGAHAYRALEGTCFGGCLFSGRQPGRAAAVDSA